MLKSRIARRAERNSEEVDQVLFRNTIDAVPFQSDWSKFEIQIPAIRIPVP